MRRHGKRHVISLSSSRPNMKNVASYNTSARRAATGCLFRVSRKYGQPRLARVGSALQYGASSTRCLPDSALWKSSHVTRPTGSIARQLTPAQFDTGFGSSLLWLGAPRLEHGHSPLLGQVTCSLLPWNFPVTPRVSLTGLVNVGARQLPTG